MGLLQYIEVMQTECNLLGNPLLKSKAIKIDGKGKENSLKYYLEQNSLKSCDYLKLKSQHMIFIEFSDLNQEYIDLSKQELQRDTALDEASVLRSNKKIFPKSLDAIHDGINQKIAETLVLMTIMEQKFNLMNNPKRTKNFMMGICSARQSDVLFFDSISRKLKQKYQKNILDRVLFLPYTEIDTFLTTK